MADLFSDALDEAGDQAAAQAQPTQQAPAPGGKQDEFGDALDEALRQRTQSATVPLRQATTQAQDTTPDRAASVQKISAATGLPTDVIDRNYDAMSKRLAVDQTPFSLIVKQTPNLAEWAANPVHAAVAKDDMANLGALEWLLQMPAKAIAQTLNGQGYAALRTRDMIYGDLTQEQRDLMNSYKLGMQRDGTLGVGDSWFKGALTGSLKLATQLGASVPVYGLVGATGGAVVGGLGGSLLGPGGTIGGALAGGKLGFEAGNTYGFWKQAAQQEAATAYDKFLEMKDETGQPLDPKVAQVGALAVAALNSGLMVAGGRIVRAGLGKAADKFLGDAASTVVEKALQSPRVRSAFLEASKEYGTSLTEGTALIVGMRAVQLLGTEATTRASGQAFPHLTVNEFAQAMKEAAGQGLQDFSLVAGAGPALGFASDAARAGRAENARTFYTALGDGAKQSKTIERLPEAAQQLLAAATKGGPIENLYAPLDPNPATGQVGWNQYWQSKGVDPAEMAATVTGKPDAYATAVREGSDLAIPTARYATTIAPTEHAAHFANELRLGPDEMNPLDVDAFKKRIAAEAAPTPEQPNALRQQVVDELTKRGVKPEDAAHYADLVGSLSTLGERAGLPDLLQPYGITVGRPGLEGGDVPADAVPKDVPVGREGEAELNQGQAGPHVPTLEQPEDDVSRLQRNAPPQQAEPLALTQERRQTAGEAPGGVERRRNEPYQAMGDVTAAARQLREEGFYVSQGEMEAGKARVAAAKAARQAQVDRVLEPGAPTETSFNLQRSAERIVERVQAPDPRADQLTGAVEPGQSVPTRTTSPALSDEAVRAFTDEVQARVGPDLQYFSVALTNAGDLHLGMLAIDRGARRAGVGSSVMNDLTKFADEHGVRVLLSPSERNDEWGTTSRDRLVDFYKRFGFVENTGAHADAGITAEMYRDPTAVAGERELFQSGKEEEPGDVFYSRLRDAIESHNIPERLNESASGSNWKQIINNAGVNRREFRYADAQMLDDRTRYTRQEVLDFLEANRPKVETVKLGEDEEGNAVGEIDEDALRERADEIHSRMVDEAMNDLDWSEYLGSATTVEDEEEIEVEKTDRDGEVVLDEAGDPVMTTEYVTRYYPAIEGGYTYERRPGGGRRLRERRRTEIIEDADSYEDESEAEEAAQRHIDNLDRDPFYDQAYESASESVDYSEAEQEAREELEGEQRREGGAAVQYQQYSEPGYEADTYREVFLTVPQLDQVLRKGETVEQAAVRMFDTPWDKLTLDQQNQIRRGLKWVDGHEPYKNVPNPIARLRFDMRHFEGREIPGGPPDAAIMRQGAEADALLGDMAAARGLTPTALFVAADAPALPLLDAMDDFTDVEKATVKRLVEASDAAHAEANRAAKGGTREAGPSTFFLEEIQPPRPTNFAKMPKLYQDNWRELSLKWALRQAVEQGAERLAWTNGKQQAKRYGLNAVLSKLVWSTPTAEEISDGRAPAGSARTVELHLRDGGDITADVNERGIVIASERLSHRAEGWVGHPLEDVIGKEHADRITGPTSSEQGERAGGGLEVFGEGLRRLYDHDFAIIANKLQAMRKAGVTVDSDLQRFGDKSESITVWQGAPVNEARVRDVAAERLLPPSEEHMAQLSTHEQGEVLDKRADEARILNALADSISDGSTVEEAMRRSGYAPELEALLGGRLVKEEHPVPGERIQGITITPALRAEVLGGQPLFQERRGVIRFGPGKQFHIDLLERADLSTFLHETGHFFLEVFSDAADQLKALDPATLTDSQRKVLSDYDTTLRYLGVGDRAGIGTKEHETWARSFEAYLMKGEAPSAALQGSFSRFRAWLTGIYRTMSALKVNLTPEVTGVMDRLIASDRAIQEAEDRRGVVQMFATPEDAGMSPKEFEAYRAVVGQASATAREQLDRKIFDQVQKEKTRAWKEAQRAVQTKVESETYARNDYKALWAMMRGTQPDGTTPISGDAATPMKLSKALLVERFGKKRLNELPRMIYSKEGGLDPDVVAQSFGFPSGDAMLKAVSDAPNMQTVIKNETAARMVQEHGNILLDGTLPLKAQGAVSNVDRDAILRVELQALHRKAREVAPFVKAEAAKAKTAAADALAERAYERRWFEAEAKLRIAIAEGKKQAEIDDLTQQVKDARETARGGPAALREGIPPAALLRETAKERIAGMQVSSLQPQAFWSTSRRAAQAAIEAALRGDVDGAIKFKTQELLHLNYYREAERALEDVQARIERAQELAGPKAQARLGLAGGTYREQINTILDRYDFAAATEPQLARRANIRDWVAGLESQGLPVDLPPEVLDDARRQHYTALTVDELKGVTDGLQQLEHLAQLKNRLIKSADKRELEVIGKSGAASIRENNTGGRSTLERDRRASTERARTFGDFFASHRKLASLARELDGFKDGGFMVEHVVRPLNEAANREATMHAEATMKLGQIIEEAYPGGKGKRELYEKVHIPAIGASLSKMERLSVMLNWGNEGNRDRIRASEGWRDDQVSAILNTLDARDAKFVQNIFDYIGSYKAEMGAKQERVYGVQPEWVEPTPIQTAAGEIPGGYFPIKQDERFSASAANNLDFEAGNLAKQAAYGNATTARGHLKARLETPPRTKLRRDFGVIFEHVNQVIHDLSHHEALIDVGRVLANRDVQQAILDTKGDQVYKQIKNTIRDVAFGDVAARNGFERGLNNLRAGSTVAGLGWSLSTAMLHLTGAVPKAFVRIGPVATSKGLLRWTRDAVSMENSATWIEQKSEMMRNRGRTQQREINEIRNAVGVNTGKFSGWISDIVDKTSFGLASKQGLVDSYFYLVQQMQRAADIPTWLGEYQKHMDAGIEESDAVARADQAVLDAFGGGQVKDLSSVQRGGPMMKLWTNFYSPFNATFNLTAEALNRTRWTSPGSVGRLAVDYLMLYTVPAVLGYAIHHAARAGSQTIDNAETLAGELVRANIAYMADTMVGVRELSGAIQGFYGYEGPAGASIFADMAKLWQQSDRAVTKLKNGEPQPLDASFWRSLNDVGGIVFHYPAGQVGRTLAGLQALEEGRTNNPGVLVVGPPPKK
jgi:GNAT superfamily N-acetyltransferase